MSKNQENRRKTHAAQLAKQVNKRNEHEETAPGEAGALANQYKVIREDLMKLRDDLTKGYDLAKDAVDKKTIFSELLRLRGNH